MKESFVWIGRNNFIGASLHDYELCPLDKAPVFHKYGYWSQTDKYGEGVSITLCKEHYEHLFPDFCLEPGEGPIRVKVTMERAPIDEPTLLEKEKED